MRCPSDRGTVEERGTRCATPKAIAPQLIGAIFTLLWHRGTKNIALYIARVYVRI